MIYRRYRIALVGLMTLGALASAPALDWSTTQIAVTPARGAEVVRTKFDYKNAAKKAVHILEVKTSCGCTEATPTASVVAPGEIGAVYVVFTVGKRTGVQEKEITILTDDSKVPVRLSLKVNLPGATAEAAVPPR